MAALRDQPFHKGDLELIIPHYSVASRDSQEIFLSKEETRLGCLAELGV